mmetsp:Transcript_4061/g.10565  ORF Transcript_4061/g.10565 Transcript_4061/m.10565 type:complete len:209 (+) Transcript_4061:296-922(+)
MTAVSLPRSWRTAAATMVTPCLPCIHGAPVHLRVRVRAPRCSSLHLLLPRLLHRLRSHSLQRIAPSVAKSSSVSAANRRPASGTRPTCHRLLSERHRLLRPTSNARVSLVSLLKKPPLLEPDKSKKQSRRRRPRFSNQPCSSTRGAGRPSAESPTWSRCKLGRASLKYASAMGVISGSVWNAQGAFGRYGHTCSGWQKAALSPRRGHP